jgi:hypothetical protein
MTRAERMDRWTGQPRKGVKLGEESNDERPERGEGGWRKDCREIVKVGKL